MRVYLLGASGVGKTTISNLIQKSIGLIKLGSAARETLAEMGIDRENLKRDLLLANEFQERVWARQEQMEQVAGDNFISDRAFDALAYTVLQSTCAWKIARSEYFARQINEMRFGDRVFTFFVRPSREVWESACKHAAKSGDVQAHWMNWDEVIAVDSMIRIVLEANDVPYIPVESPSLQTRERQVVNTLKLLKRYSK